MDFGDAFSSQDSFLELAMTFEDTGRQRLQRRRAGDRVEGAAGDRGCDRPGRGAPCGDHRIAAGEDPAPEAFDPTLTEDEVLKAVKPFLAG